MALSFHLLSRETVCAARELHAELAAQQRHGSGNRYQPARNEQGEPRVRVKGEVDVGASIVASEFRHEGARSFGSGRFRLWCSGIW